MFTEKSFLGDAKAKLYTFFDSQITKVLNFFNGRVVVNPIVEPEFERIGGEDEKAKAEIFAENIEDLLDGITTTYKKLSTRNINVNMPMDMIGGLLKIGPTIIPKSHDSYKIEGRKIDTQKLPFMIYLATNNFDKYEEEDTSLPDSFFAVKMKKKPVACAKVKGTIYEVGFTYFDEKYKGNIWHSLYVSIINGELKIIRKIPHIKTEKTPSTKGRRPAYIRHLVFGPQPFIQTIASDPKYKGKTTEEVTERLEEFFACFFLIWQQRLDFWRIAVEKRGKRMTFLIQQKDPKVLFKDRKITALTPTGQRKRIIHYVSGHLRHANRKTIWINEHLRGERKFIWSGCDCAILAPKFHKINMDDFTYGAHIFEEGEEKPRGFITMNTLARKLINAEARN